MHSQIDCEKEKRIMSILEVLEELSKDGIVALGDLEEEE